MAKMTVAVFQKANAPLEIETRDVPEPGPGWVLLKVHACGVCHSDLFVRGGAFPGLTLPRVPGHEVAAVVEKVGAGVRPWKPGDRVGVGWHGGHCFVCDSCRVGDFVTCVEEKVTGFAYDGGYATWMVARAEALARIPDALGFVEAAPLMCAGVTTFNSIRHTGVRPGELVAVLGLGGLGHLAVQFAHKMGLRTIGIARGDDKAPLAEQLGADDYIDTTKTPAGAALAKLGGAKLIVSTIVHGPTVVEAMGGLGVSGQMLVLGAVAEPLPISTVPMILRRQSLRAWPSGHAKDSEETLQFAVDTGVRPMTEIFPLEQANEALERMESGKARFRAVLQLA
ncbi:MAG: alcohol dehydrogenase catalytic domain-containing protein [bacterium]|nr:alcohol dehydrogenase catalytic domain-containing protein [bacterium]